MFAINPTTFDYFLRHLSQVAQDKRVVPYNELENAFGLSHNMVGEYAGAVGKFCIDNNYPLLNSLIINITDCAPSEGFHAWYLESDVGDAHYPYTGLSWGEMISACWRFFHVTSSRAKQVQNFSGMTPVHRSWAEKYVN